MCLNIGNNKETLKLMKASGCKAIFVGLESVSEASLKAQNKNQVNNPNDYTRLAKNITNESIILCAATMYGFDEDTPKSLFEDTLKFVVEMGVSVLQAHIVTPYPHSDLFKTLKSENRLITEEAKYYNGYTVVYKPAKMSAYELQKGFIEIRKRFYSFPSVIKRMFHHKPSMWLTYIICNAIYRKPNYMAIPDVDINEWLDYLKSIE